MRLALAFLLTGTVSCAQNYSLGPDSQPHDGVPKGTVTKYELAPGKFFPGTPHNYSVYVPAQYEASKPTPFMIYMDGSGSIGNGQRVPVVFDNLIARHELPPMIGIFIDPGVLPALNGAQSRYERIFEYDSISGRFSDFLITELIPEVSKKYNLSHNPDDRGLAGVSTGAVAAFVAAWNRPDQFHRVLSFIGTYVAMKGADELPALIRKTETKPIRLYLQDGKNDHIVAAEPYGTFYAGSWPINNQVMYEALQYAGYDVHLEIGEGGHDMRQGGAIMPDALRWLWREYPKPIVAHDPPAMSQPGWDPRGKVQSIVSVDKPWEPISGAYQSAVSPAGDREGNLYFSDPASHRIYKVAHDGDVSMFRDHVDARALAVAPDGRVIAAQSGIVAYDPSGSGEKVIAKSVSPSALAVTANGGIYYAVAADHTIGYIAPGGAPRTVFTAPTTLSGLALSADQAMLAVSDSLSRFSWSFQIAADGSLINGEEFYRLEMPEQGFTSGVTDVAQDTSGQVYFATERGIEVCEANGRLATLLNAPSYGSVSSLAFVGDWLYVSSNSKVYRRPVKVRGAEAWNIVKLPKPPL
jgi:enterochelin esterase-like enzyme/sugar lactone lactonase YvrE